MKLDGRVAIITGAGRGLGRGIALALAAEGARVVVVDRTSEGADAVDAEIAATGAEALAVHCDVCVRAEVQAAVAATVERFGRIDIVVNCAQAMTYKSIRKLTDEDMLAMYQSGPMGTLRFMQEAFPHLRETKGCVVNVGSGTGILVQPAVAGYASAKEAIRTLTRGAAIEWGRFGIRVNAICPLAVTPGSQEFNSATGGAFDGEVAAAVPLGRIGDPLTDVAPAVVFLASDEARYITGTTLMVDGGYNSLR